MRSSSVRLLLGIAAGRPGIRRRLIGVEAVGLTTAEEWTPVRRFGDRHGRVVGLECPVQGGAATGFRDAFWDSASCGNVSGRAWQSIISETLRDDGDDQRELRGG